MLTRLWRSFAASLLLSLAVFLPGLSNAQKTDAQPKVVPEAVMDERVGSTIAKGQLLVTLHQGVKEEELTPIFERMDAKFTILKRLPSMNHFEIATDHERLPELRQRLENHPYVAAVSYNMLVHLKRVTNDPVFKKPEGMPEDRDNWNLYRIKAPEAWDITRGGAVVAVIDSGAVLDHEELVGRTTNPFSFATNSPVMQDGMKKLWYGPMNVQDGEVRDHGTHVAITIGGKADNAAGTAGIAPDSPIMPLQALYYLPRREDPTSGQIRGWGSAVTDAMARAIDQGASVINMSLGGVNPDDLARWRAAKSPQEKQAVYDKMTADARQFAQQLGPFLDRAIQRGVIIVVAAGNDDIPAEFGAYAMSRRVITVAATTREDKRCNFMQSKEPGQPIWGSNYGPYTTVSAPGHDIWSGWAEPGKPYKYNEGTSMACPHVAGVVALMKTVDPELKLADVADILVKTGKPLQTDQPIGPLVNAKAALDEVKRRQATRPPPQPPLPPIVQPPRINPTPPTLPPDAITILTLPNPWDNPNFQRIVQVWLSFAIAPAPPGGGQGFWIYNRFGQVINIRINININFNINVTQPIWSQFTYRWLWENSMILESTNMGSLYEFVVGTLRQGRFNAAPPRVPENVRPKPDDPRPPRAGGLPYNPGLGGTRWTGRNGQGQTLEFDFGKDVVTIRRNKMETRYSVRINTAVTPATIDFYPDGGGDPLRGLVEMVGFGEILIRTDFTDKRPATISRGDPLTFVLRRADIEITHPGATEDGVQMPIHFRGTESLFTSLDPSKKFDPKTAWGLAGFYLHNYALSADGQRVWLMLFSQAEAHKADPWQLWSMRTDGTDAKRSPFVRPKDTNRASTVYTNADGSIAWIMTLPYWVHLQQATPGNAAKLVVAEVKEDFNPNTPLAPTVTADGKKFFFIGTQGIIEVRDDGHFKYVVKSKEIVYKGLHPYYKIWSLAIDAKGENWATVASFMPPKAKNVIEVVVKGSPTGTQFYEATETIGHVTMSEDGKSMLIQPRNQAKPIVQLWRDGHVRPILPDVMGFRETILSGDGNTMYAENTYLGTTMTGYGILEDLRTGVRRRVMSKTIAGRPNWSSVRLSRDAKVLVSYAPLGENNLHGLYVFRADAAPSALDPQIKSVRQRYEGGKLIITAEISSPDPLGEIAIQPLKNGYLDVRGVLPETQNPLQHINYMRFAAVPKRPGFFEHTTEIGARHALLDGSYSFRIVAVNADRTRTTFQDIAILK